MTNDPIQVFETERDQRIREYADSELAAAGAKFMLESTMTKYSYNFSFMGRPIIQYPQDMVAMQELIWAIQPDLIIETGIAHGGSLVMSAAMLSLIDQCESIKSGTALDLTHPARRVLGIDIDIRSHNRTAIEAHPMANRIEMIQGSAIDPVIVNQVKSIAQNHERVLVCLDSNHTHDHVLAELHAYASLVSVGSYCVVFDTIVENVPAKMYPDRPWGPGNNPKTAVQEYLSNHPEFEIDHKIDNQLLISVAPHGYLKRIA